MSFLFQFKRQIRGRKLARLAAARAAALSYSREKISYVSLAASAGLGWASSVDYSFSYRSTVCSARVRLAGSGVGAAQGTTDAVFGPVAHGAGRGIDFPCCRNRRGRRKNRGTVAGDQRNARATRVSGRKDSADVLIAGGSFRRHSSGARHKSPWPQPNRIHGIDAGFFDCLWRGNAVAGKYRGPWGEIGTRVGRTRSDSASVFASESGRSGLRLAAPAAAATGLLAPQCVSAGFHCGSSSGRTISPSRM